MAQAIQTRISASEFAQLAETFESAVLADKRIDLKQAFAA